MHNDLVECRFEKKAKDTKGIVSRKHLQREGKKTINRQITAQKIT